MELKEKHSLKDYPEKEKKAYLAAVASMATPEDSASAEEVEFLEDLCDDAQLSEADKAEVIKEAKSPSNDGFESYLSYLTNSELKYSFIVDVISFAKADGHYSEEEKEKILYMANKLGVSKEQYDALYEYVDKAASTQDQDTSEEGFLESTGLKQKFESRNIPVKGLLTGLVGSMLMKGTMGRRHRRGGLLSSLLGAGATRRRGGGGLSSVIGMLSGGRGYRRSGGLLRKLL
ncbi:putative tellurite resistance protein B-like protein [Catalinimonas alkaloidigena]|uniref:tellurite resistance TerB family protein n=1 Tax=Catalinimonas alkaloidigena TaxID=1075417 RepID=UPI002405B76D|nr:TerB family tellurite resistance protein [Catalinimonas alkaloidigena]MDF9795985.1 putative tellurite resistance protein B-like protein [Catalinimonas alkaloidigena]